MNSQKKQKRGQVQMKKSSKKQTNSIEKSKLASSRLDLMFQEIEKGERIPVSYTEMEQNLTNDIRKNGFVQDDKRYKRKVWSLPGHFIVIKDPKILNYLLKRTILSKYVDDWARIITSFLAAANEAKRDVDSRQLMVFNDMDFSVVKQCFTHMQFVYTARKEFDLYVYQRSADMEKLKDDLTFFAHVGQAFGIEVRKKVTKIVVVYGSVHFTKE